MPDRECSASAHGMLLRGCDSVKGLPGLPPEAPACTEPRLGGAQWRYRCFPALSRFPQLSLALFLYQEA